MVRTVGLWFAALVVGLLAWSPVHAMPNFAKKYNMSCDGCHTTIPRLNETGFEFRKAGFRNPEEIGEEAKTAFANTFAARIQARYDLKHRKNPGTTPATTTEQTTSQLTFQEVTLYPLSMAFGTNYASLMELSIASEDFVEIENAYFRYVNGKDVAFFSGRLGIMHPFEGYGASDRPYSLSRPFLQTNATNQNGSTFFTPWNFDQMGLDLAYCHKKTTLSGTVFNGIVLKDDEGSFKAFPAAGGELQKPTTGFKNRNSKDVQVFLNQILKDNGSGVSLYWYHGFLDLPKRAGMDPADFVPDSSFGNTFDRLAAYAGWRLTPKFEVQGAYQYGKDHLYDTVTNSAEDTFKSQGWFGELDAPLSERVTLGARYDFFDPSQDKADNTKRGITGFANIPMNDGLQWIAEYQHIQTERAGRDDLKDDNFQVRMIWIW
jgi:hypothetical protein